MAQTQTVFERYEKKYLLTEAQYFALRRKLEGRMTADEYGKHTICNLYFDTEQYDLIRTSLEKPAYKEKLRVRSYGVPEKDGKCFVEIKKKFKGVVYKRRVEMALPETKIWLKSGIRPENFTQIHREIEWFMQFYRPEPRMYLAYDRIAMFGNENSELRMTFDGAIRWRTEDLDLTHGDRGALILEPGQRLLEVKIPGAMPLWMAELFDELNIRSSSFSKYGACYQQLFKESGNQLILGDVLSA